MVEQKVIIRCFIVTVLLLLFFSMTSYAQESTRDKEEDTAKSRFQMEEVVVTATGLEDEVRNVARNVTVITAEDIAQSPSNFVPDLLSRETNVNLQSLYGTDKQAVVDIRGMGQTTASNVLVLVDGFRLNSPDLAGPDFSSVPIDQIERIEIIRGAGSVIYGSGAVGGVVNIITKRGKKEPTARPYASYGSYDTFDGRISGGGQIENLDVSLNADYFDTDGYRDNGGLRKKDFGARLGYDATEHIGGDLFEGVLFNLSGTYHEDKEGFPGGVPIEDIDSESERTKASTPNDGAETEDNRVRGGIEVDIGSFGVLTLNGGVRHRDSKFIFGFTPLKPKEAQISRLNEDTQQIDFGYTQEYSLWGLENTFQFGTDYYYTDYYSERLDQRERKNSQIDSLGFFFTNRSSLSEKFSLDIGYRYNIYKGTFRNDELVDFSGDDVWVNGAEFDRNYYDNAYNIGIVYAPAKSTSLYSSFATSFRIPNVDEFALADDNLKPQKGWHVDVGLRQQFKDLAEVSLSLFYFEIDDEIFFDADARENRNFEDTTQRFGVETSLKFYPTDRLYLWGNLTVMQAEFKGSGNQIPLVPNYSAKLGMEWRILDPLLLALTGSFIGSQYDGNDITNDRFAKLDPYQVFDAKLTYTFKKFTFFCGVNNIFNELYETVAFSESYFPMPTRNYYAGLALSL
ncbi:MAG: TonB-dependent receptor [Desulfobacterales bacterium]|jgi:TonB-dependent siderophore receptor